MQSAQGERAPWRPERKKHLKDRRCCGGDAEGNGSKRDSHGNIGAALSLLPLSTIRAAGLQGAAPHTRPFLLR